MMATVFIGVGSRTAHLLSTHRCALGVESVSCVDTNRPSTR